MGRLIISCSYWVVWSLLPQETSPGNARQCKQQRWHLGARAGVRLQGHSGPLGVRELRGCDPAADRASRHPCFPG